MKDLTRVLKEQRDAEDRARRRDPSKMVVYSETVGGDQSFTDPSDAITEAVESLNALTGDVTIAAADSITVNVAGQTVTIGGGGGDPPEPLAEVNTATYKGLGVFTDWPTCAIGNLVALKGVKNTFMSFYLEDSQSDFEPGELTNVEATAAGLELVDVGKWYNEGEEGVTWVEGYSSGTGSQSKQSDHLYLYLAFGSDNQRHYETDEKIDITDVDSLIIDWHCLEASKAFGMVRFGITSNKGTDRADYVEYIQRSGGDSSAPFARTEDTLDVSGYSGSYYIKIAVREGPVELKVYNVYKGGKLIGHGNRIALPQDLTTLSTDPGLEIKWTSTEPVGTDVTIETAVKGETAHTDEAVGTGDGAEDTFYLDYYPAERHSDVVVSVDGTPTTDFTRDNADDPREIIFDAGSEPGNTLAVTATYTGVTEPDETAEVQTLYLGGATGGTYDLGITGDMATLAYDDDAAAIETALEAIFGTDLVTVAVDTDFTITFSVRVRASALTADFTSLTGATAPTLTETTAYSAGDWAEQTTATAITNIPAGSLVGQHLWIRQTLETDDPAETPTLTEVEVYYGVTTYGIFTTAGTVETL